MSLSGMKNQSFPNFSLQDWKLKAQESLKGKPVEALQRTTYENIKLKPLYTSADKKCVSEFPGVSDFRRGNEPLGYITNKWRVAQQIPYRTPEELKEKLGLALGNGQTAISFKLTHKLFAKKDFLAQLIGNFFRHYPFAIEANGFQTEFLRELKKLVKQEDDGRKITGYIGSDPLSSFVEEGAIPVNTADFFENWSKTIAQANENFPSLRTVLVNMGPYHNGGANAVQELGIAAAAGVFYLQSLLDNDFRLEEALAKLVFKFSIGANYFMEIAKLRAGRIIWNKIAEVYGAEEKSRGMIIAAETSAFTKTVYDPYVNLLRAGSEAFAAVVGGIQYLHVHAFDEITATSPFSERIARNSQLILQEETHLQKVIDPAGGSWYIEELTNELAQSAWVFFQEIEENGGILAALKSNWLQTRIAEIYEKRKLDIFTRKQSMIGTNVYANLDDIVAEKAEPKTAPATAIVQNEVELIQAIPQLRLAEPYEALRKRAEGIRQKSGNLPLVGLICLGGLKQHKARLDFVRGFMSAGGIDVLPSEPILTVKSAEEFVANTKTKHFCICGTNDDYETLGYEVLQSLKAGFADCHIYLAGLPDREEQQKWLEKGLKQLVHMKSNCFETISCILSEMEVLLNGQIQA